MRGRLVGGRGALALAALACAACGRTDPLDEAAPPAAPAPPVAASTAERAGPMPIADATGSTGPADGWQEITPPPSLGLAGLRVTGAWAAGPDDIFFAATSYDPNGAPGPWDQRVVRWKAGSWSPELSARLTSMRPQISGTAPDDVWAALGDGLYHRDAAGWTLDGSWHAPLHSGGPAACLAAISAVDRDEVWAAGCEAIFHRAGGAWDLSALTVLPPDHLSGYDVQALWVGGPHEVWVGGSTDYIGSTMDPALLDLHGRTSWSALSAGAGGVYALWGDGAGGVWLASPEYDFTLAHDDGTTFTPTRIDGWRANSRLHTLWGRRPDDIWAAGDDVVRFDGASWTIVSDAPVAVRPNDGYGQTLVTGDATSVWLVGKGPRFFRKRDPP